MKIYHSTVLNLIVSFAFLSSCAKPDNNETKTPIKGRLQEETFIIETASERKQRLLEIENAFQDNITKLNNDLVNARMSDNLNDEIDLYRQIGVLNQDRGFYDEAVVNFMNCLDISQKHGNLQSEIRACNDIGEVYITQKKLNEAKKQFTSNLERCKNTYCREEHVRALSGLSKLYFDSYDIQLFKGVNYQISEILNEIDYPEVYAGFLVGQGMFESKYGSFEKSLDNFKTALSIAKSCNNLSLEAVILNHLGSTYLDYNNKRKRRLNEISFDFFIQSLDIWRILGNEKMEARVLRNIGLLIMDRLADKDGALPIYEKSLDIFREIGDKQEIGQTLNNIAYIYSSRPDAKRNLQKAIIYMKESLEIARDLQDESDIQWRSFGLGMFYYRNGEYSEAIDCFKESLEIIEMIRSRIKHDDVKRKYFDAQSHIDTYEWIIWAFKELGQTEEIYKYVQMSRARSFLDLLECRNQQKVIEDLDDGTLEQQNPISVEYSNASLLERIKRVEPDIFTQLSSDPISIKEIQSYIPSDTKIIEYFSGGSLIFVIGQNDFSQFEYRIDTNVLHKFVLGHKERISNQDLSDSLSKDLYNILIDPIIGKISQSKYLIIIPHGNLHSLPFQSLQDSSGKYLIEKYAITYLPSASVLKYINGRRHFKENNLLAFANPKTSLCKPGSDSIARNNLQSFFYILSEVVTRSIDIVTQDIPFAEKEVKLISNLFTNSSVFIGTAATERQFKVSAPEFRYIHLACHGELDSDQPLFSRLFLAASEDEDGLLEVYELFSLNLNADLVVLSACETARGKLSGGDDLIGLSRAFICAGTPSVIASLWKVEDKSTAFMMQQFYTYLQSGSNKAQALQKAQIDAKNKYEDIYFWAPFILIGAMK